MADERFGDAFAHPSGLWLIARSCAQPYRFTVAWSVPKPHPSSYLNASARKSCSIKCSPTCSVAPFSSLLLILPGSPPTIVNPTSFFRGGWATGLRLQYRSSNSNALHLKLAMAILEEVQEARGNSGSPMCELHLRRTTSPRFRNSTEVLGSWVALRSCDAQWAKTGGKGCSPCLC